MAWGLEIAADRLRLCSASPTHAGAHIRAGGEIGLPPSLIVPSFTRTNLPDPPRLARFLTRLASVLGCRGWVRAVLPDEVFSLRTILSDEISVGATETRRYLRWRARELLPFGPEETRLDYLAGVARREGGLRFPCLFARDSVLLEYERLLERAGLRAVRIDARSITLAQTASRGLGVGTRALLTLRPGRLTLLILEDGRARFWRTVALPQSLEGPALVRVHREVEDSILFCQQSEGTNSVQEVLVDGPRPLAQRVVEGLAAWLDVPVATLNTESFGKLTGASAAEQITLWGPAIGAAVSPWESDHGETAGRALMMATAAVKRGVRLAGLGAAVRDMRRIGESAPL